MLPDLLREIVDNIKIALDQEIEDEAIINTFMAKFCSIMASKQILTDSILHDEPIPLQYYAINLLPSGMGKNRSKTLVDQLFEWYEWDCKSANIDYKNKEIEHINTLYKDIKSREKAYKEIFEYTPELNGASAQAIYEVASWIVNNMFGSLYFFNTEFAKMFTEKQDYNNFLSMALDGADGMINYTSVLTNRRKTLDKKVSMSMYLAGAYGTLLEPGVKKKFQEEGNNGLFRRTFVYFLDDLSSVTSKQNYTYEAVMNAKSSIKEVYGENLKQIYNNISSNTLLQFSEEANKLIRQYKKTVEKEVKKEFRYSETLLPSDESYKINLINSPWKITKVAFLLHLLDLPNQQASNTVTPSTVEKAIEYFNMFNGFLPKFLNKKPITYRTYILSYILKYLDKVIPKNQFLEDIRDLVFVDLPLEEWANLKPQLTQLIANDVITQGICCEEAANEYVRFYKINNDNTDLGEL